MSRVDELRLSLAEKFRAFERRDLEHKVRLEERAVEYYTQQEALYAKHDTVSDSMRAWCKKQRKKRQSDLDWARAQLEKFDAKVR